MTPQGRQPLLFKCPLTISLKTTRVPTPAQPAVMSVVNQTQPLPTSNDAMDLDPPSSPQALLESTHAEETRPVEAKKIAPHVRHGVPSEEEFPALPSLNCVLERGSLVPRIKLLFKNKPADNPKQLPNVDSSKRHDPPSPMADRRPKRHTSTVDPPLESPASSAQADSSDESPPNSPTDYIQRKTISIGPYNRKEPPLSQPRFSFSASFPLRPTRSVSSPTRSTNFDLGNNCRELNTIDPSRSGPAGVEIAGEDTLVNSPLPPTPFDRNADSNSTLAGSSLALTPSCGTLPTSSNPQHVSSQTLNLSVPRGKKFSVKNIYHDLKTENDITTNASNLQRTSTPSGGWPKIHLGSSPFDNVILSQVEDWKKVTTPRLWARLFRGKNEKNGISTVDSTRALIKNLVRIENDITFGVSYPRPETIFEANRFPPPYHMLVSGLTLEQAEHLINLEVVATKDITIIFVPFEEVRPTFVLTIQGLTFTDSPEAREVVLDLVRSRFKESEAVMKHIADSAPMLKDRVVRNIFNNLAVKFLEVKRSDANGGNIRAWNVYMNHSYLPNDEHIKLIQIMRNCTFPSATSGFGVPLKGRETLFCVNCKSIDHDMPNCPFPGLPGWLGYKPAVEPPHQNSRRAYGDGETRTFEASEFKRGRGRGRGRGGRGSGYDPRRGSRNHWN